MTQTERHHELLKDGQPHRTDEIVEKVYGPGMSLARVGARQYDVEKKYGVEIAGWHDAQNPKLYLYRMAASAPLQPILKIPAQAPVMPPAFKTPPRSLTENTYLL